MTRSRSNRRFVRRTAQNLDRPVLQNLERRRLLSATPAEIAAALDLPEGVVVTMLGHGDGVGVYENYSVEGLLGLPTGPDGDFLVMSTAHAFDAVRTTDPETRDGTTHYRDLGTEGAADDFVTVSFTLTVPAGLASGSRLLIDFIYASDMGTDGGDFFDIIVNGTNLGMSDARGRIEAGGAYVTNERDPELADTIPGFGFTIGTEYSDLQSAAYTIPDGTTTLDVTIQIADLGDPEFDAWALIDNLRIEQPQTIFLDFDGQDIGGFYLEGTHYDVPGFDANDFGLGNNYADVIRADLEALFADFNVVFVTDQPAEGPFMHVVIGGRNTDTVAVDDTEPMQWLIRELDLNQNDPETTFSKLYNYLNFRQVNGTNRAFGIADRLDLGNADHDDMAVIFSEEIHARGYDYTKLRDTIAHYIGRNLGLRPEADSATGSIMNVDIAQRGSAFQDMGNQYLSDRWGDINFDEQPGIRQNAHDLLLDILGSSGGDMGIVRSYADTMAVNRAHWTITPPINRALRDATFVVIGDAHTRTATTFADEWAENQIIVTDYAGRDPQIVITAASRDNGRIEYETRGTRNLGLFSNVIRESRVSLLTMFSAGDPVFFYRGTTTLIQTEAAATEVYYSTFDYTDVDGDIVTLRLNSREGLFSVSNTGEGLVIFLGETDADRDTFTITVKRRDGGDGRVNISGIQGSGLRTLKATRTDWDGTGFDLLSLRTARLGSIMNGTDVNVRQNIGVRGDFIAESIGGDSRFVFGRETRRFRADEVMGGTYSFDELIKIDILGDFHADRLDIEDGDRALLLVRGNVVGGVWTVWTESDKRESWKTIRLKGDATGVTINAPGRVKTLNVTGSFDADIEALAFYKLIVRQDLSGDILLTHDGDHFKQAALSIKVSGSVHDLLLRSGDSINVFSLGRVEDSRIYVGFDFSVTDGLVTDSGLITNEDARVKTFRLRGLRDNPDEMVNTIVSAVEFGKITLGDVDGDNGGVPFGISARSIDSITFDTGTGRIRQKRDEAFIDNDNGDDFLLGRIL